jgi:hypothetical protein
MQCERTALVYYNYGYAIRRRACALHLCLETRLDRSPHLKPGYNRHVRTENRPKCKH